MGQICFSGSKELFTQRAINVSCCVTGFDTLYHASWTTEKGGGKLFFSTNVSQWSAIKIVQYSILLVSVH